MGDLRGFGAPAARPEWKLRTPAGELVTTIDQLLALLLVERAPLAEQRKVLSTFLGLSVAATMPSELRATVEARID